MKFALMIAAALATASAWANEPQAAPALKGDPKQAQATVTQVCAACHAVDGNSVAPANPRLAGLNYEYINKQLQNFKSGERKSAIMSGMVANLTPQDMQNLAAYYSAQQPKDAKAKDQALALLGQKVYRGGVQGSGVPACASCHGDSFSKPIDPSYPKIAGQHSDYLYVALKSYKIENNPQVGRGNAIMGGVAKQFSNAELKELANYVGGLPGELKTVPQNRFK